MINDAAKAIDAFTRRYDGMFGRFKVDADPEPGFATASSPDRDNTSIVQFSFPEDLVTEFENHRTFIESKRIRLEPMGVLEKFEYSGGFTESLGGILNFDLMGKKGGFLYYTAHVGGMLLFIQAYHTAGGGQIPYEEAEQIVNAVREALD